MKKRKLIPMKKRKLIPMKKRKQTPSRSRSSTLESRWVPVPDPKPGAEGPILVPLPGKRTPETLAAREAEPAQDLLAAHQPDGVRRELTRAASPGGGSPGGGRRALEGDVIVFHQHLDERVDLVGGARRFRKGAEHRRPGPGGPD